jgi:hypothetical protein
VSSSHPNPNRNTRLNTNCNATLLHNLYTGPRSRRPTGRRRRREAVSSRRGRCRWPRTGTRRRSRSRWWCEG